MALHRQAQAIVRQHIDEATCHKRNHYTVQRFNESTAIRVRLGSATTQGVPAPVLRAGFDWAINRAPDPLKKEVSAELASLQALECRIAQVNQYFSEQASILHDNRVDNEQYSLEQSLLPPRQQISVQAGSVVSPPDYRASATARTNLRQSFYQPFQSYAHDAVMLRIIATEIQNCNQPASRTHDKPSNQPQPHTSLDQPQTSEPRIPPQYPSLPPHSPLPPRNEWGSRQEVQSPRRRYEEKVELEEQTSERGSSILLAGRGWKDAISISDDNTSYKQPADAISISSRVSTSSPYKSSSPLRNDGGSAQAQVVDHGGEAGLLQATASEPLQKKARVLLEQHNSLERSVDVKKERVEKEEFTNDKHDELPDIEEELTEDELDELADKELYESLLADIYMAEQDADNDQQQLDLPASLDILRTQQRKSPQSLSVSQDSKHGSQSKYSHKPSAAQDVLASLDSYYADRS
ncbi:hypothetical protein LTR15_012646 [Elasticomyces elasticus]|nr:hypothetical protein LTR15_012646 [Elasticomyces elasticus]